MADSVSHILTCIIKGEEALDNSSAISGLSANQRAKINEWNIDKAGSHTSNVSLHDAIYQRYLEDPEKPAICSWDGELSYSELMDASQRWAFKLQELGAGPGTMVPVCFEKSLWAIVSMFAISRVGAAFVPLDPSHPREYLRGIIDMVNPPLILVSSLQDQLLGDILPCTHAVDKSSTGDLPDYGTAPFPSKVSATPGYCLFTSGSTGTPKGCVVSHAALASVAGHTTALHLDRSSRALQFASFSFGVSLIEIWCTLCAGGTVCIPSDADRLNSLATTIETLHVNWAILTPTILDLLQPGTAPGLRNIVVAGEPLRESQRSLWAGSTQLFQAYGLTEWAGIFSVSPQICADDKPATIGAPACGSCWLVDPHDPDQLVAIGVVGELIIEGPSLAQGYLQNPHKTALSFITDPVWALDEGGSEQQKRRLYRTGDLAFYNCDGSLQYVGRKDLQVKIRGQRTALSVIEHHLRHGDPALGGAVVDAITLAHEDQLRLAAFVPHSEQAAGPARGQEKGGQKGSLFAVPDMAFMAQLDAVKKRLTGQLPRYMVPDIFLCVDHLPVTVTGKIARRQLRDQASTLRTEELAALTGLAIGSSHEPDTPQERAIHGLVTQVLKLPSDMVGMDRNFVALGGDSVLAMRIVAKAREAGLAISVKDIFDAPDIRALAANTKASLQPTASGGAIAPFSLVEKGALEAITQTAAELCHVAVQDVEDILPCTPLQEGMMALGQTKPGTYVARFICQINQQVNVDRLRSAWATVVAANPILRTRIIQTKGNRMHQVVIKQDLQWDTDYQWHDYVDNARYTDMKLGQPLVRGALLKGPGDPLTTFLVLTMHHSVCDRWSAGLLLDTLQAAFLGETVEKSSFAPFVKYINEVPQTQAQDFWAKEFAGLEAEVFPALPSQAHHRPSPSESLHLQVTTVPPTGATMSSFIRLAWAVVISQYTGTSDTVFGVTVTGRNAPVDGVEKLPAPTISTVPLRVQIDLNRTVQDAVAAIQQHASEMIPFEQTGLQNIRRYSREASDACGFQSHLVVQPAWHDNGRSGEKNLLRLVEDGASVQGGFASYAIVLLCSLTGTSDINMTAEFDPDVITSNIMQHILEHFGHVLQYLITHPGGRLGYIPVGAFDTATLRRWCTAVPQSQPECVHEAIQNRVAESPSACAVDAWDGRLTYAELDKISTALSIRLRLQGIKQETLIPLCFEKSQWAVVAMLAVLKAGAAFVLLDPSQPLQRLQDICSQTDSPLVLASEKNATLAASLNSTVLEVGQQTVHELPVCLEPKGPVVDPSTALYVVFTSGSTGTPKGVVVEHQSYHAGSNWHIPGHRMSSQSRVLQFASYAFDTSIIEMLSTLMAGACICIPSDHDRQNNLAQVVADLAVTHAFLTPSVARALAQVCSHRFEALILVGEPMAASDISYWTQYSQLMNEYGPAECSVCATLNPEVGVGSDPHDIGTGMGTVCWVVDPENHDSLRPVGAPGELLIEGPTVGRGYLGNPVLTAEKFLDSPPAWLHDIRPDGLRARFYKTGDLVRYKADGSLHYIGRKDTQVKLRGQRVELTEVESGVRSCMTGIVDLVAETFVPSGGAQGQDCLVAFVCIGLQGRDVPDTHPFAPVTDGFHAQVGECLQDLDKFLPRYMIPDVFIPLQRIPTNVSGKANRRLLRELAAKMSWSELATYQPKGEDRRTTMNNSSEQVLRDAWARVLNIPPEDISASDSFYHLGGDSISAMQVVALARSKGLLTSVHDILRHRSIAKIAPHIQSTDRQGLQQEEITNTPFGLSPIQRLFFDIQADPRQQFNQSFLLRLSSTIAVEDLHWAAEAVVRKHSMLRARFEQKPDGQWNQRVMPAAAMAGSYRCLVHTVPNPGQWRGIVAAAQKAIDMEKGPVFSLELINIASDQTQYLLLVAHNLVTDVVSWRIIFADLEVLLRSPRATATLDTRPLSFQVWCALQDQYSRQHLHPSTAWSPDATSQAMQDPRPLWGLADCKNVMGDRVFEHFTVDSELTQKLLGPMNAPLNTRPEELFHAVLLCAFARVFPGRSEGPLVFVERHGREPWDAAMDLSETVGWFTTIFPISVPVEQNTTSILHALRAVKDKRRAVPPAKAWAYFTSRYLHPEGPTRLGLRHPMEIVLNYAGEYKHLEHGDGLFIPDRHSILGPMDAADEIERVGLFDINIAVRGGCLEFEFIYNRRMSHQQQIKDWIRVSREGLADTCRALAAA